jgi:methylglutaconyl-CoA hydratase|tara:strand:+ start:16141 stop:16884 length:744 start_codon:yes stop_codon:yes gene_type:complete
MPETFPLIVERKGSIMTLRLNNVDKKNALNSEMMGAMAASIKESQKFSNLRAIVIRGEGSVFCSGADLNEWQPHQLQQLLNEIVKCSLPTIALVHGSCLGGGMGLACACDFILAQDDTKFGFPEVRIGMVPAVIFPYVARKLDLGKIREFFLTGENFGVLIAKEIGMLYGKYGADHSALDDLIFSLVKGGPNAQKNIKKLLNSNILSKTGEESDIELAHLINEIKNGKEGQEGISSFLQKRKPYWNK